MQIICKFSDTLYLLLSQVTVLLSCRLGKIHAHAIKVSLFQSNVNSHFKNTHFQVGSLPCPIQGICFCLFCFYLLFFLALETKENVICIVAEI